MNNSPITKRSLGLALASLSLALLPSAPAHAQSPSNLTFATATPLPFYGYTDARGFSYGTYITGYSAPSDLGVLHYYSFGVLQAGGIINDFEMNNTSVATGNLTFYDAQFHPLPNPGNFLFGGTSLTPLVPYPYGLYYLSYQITNDFASPTGLVGATGNFTIRLGVPGEYPGNPYNNNTSGLALLGPPSAVPETAAAWLLLAGFLPLGLIARKRRA